MKKLIFIFIFMLSMVICFAQEDKVYIILEKALINPDAVYGLNLKSMDLTEFPEEILQCRNLAELYLANNQLTELPEEFAELQNLRQFRLSTNQFSEFPKEILQLKYLSSLYFSENQIEILPAKISNLQRLRFLFLNDNQLQTLPITLDSLQSLEDLRLNYNQFSSFPLVITQLQGLRRLTLKGNQLTELPPEIRQLKSLKKLDLGDNQLTELPPEIGQLKSLKKLDLGDNQLTKLPPEIGQLKLSLDDLFISGNNISETEQENIKQMLPYCRVIFWENGLQLFEKKEWVSVLSNTEKNRELKFSIQFEQNVLRVRTDLLFKGKYKQNLYEAELRVNHSPCSSYDKGLFELKKNGEEDAKEYFIVSEDKVYLQLGLISEDDEIEGYLPYYSKSKYETLNQLPTKKKITKEGFLQILDEVIFVLMMDRYKLDFIYQGFGYEELNFSSTTDIIQRVFEKQGYNPFTSLKAYNKAYDKYKNQEAAKEKIASIQDFFKEEHE